MKKLGIVLALLICTVCMGLAACGNSPVGTWKLESMTTNGITIKVGESDATGIFSISEDLCVLEFKDDGTVIMSAMGVAEGTATWTQKGNTITITSAKGESNDVTIENGKITVSSDGATMVLAKK